MKAHYLAIEKIIALKMPNVKWIDMYKGQDDPDDEDGINHSPSIFISFGEREWADMGAGIQEADSTIIFHVCSMCVERTGKVPGQLNPPDPAMDHFETLDLLNKAFNGEPLVVSQYTLATELQRSNQVDSVRTKALIVDVITFSTTLYDYSASEFSNLIDIELSHLAEGFIKPPVD